jgi:Ca2+-binding RTX toxin-like protein
MTTINGHPYGEFLQGGADNDVLRGMGGDDVLYSWESDDVLDGGTGDDTLFGYTGDDYLIGGQGFDIITYSSDAAIKINLQFQERAQNTGDQGLDWLSGIEGVVGGNGADTLIGTNAANVLGGNQGDDLLRGLDGADILAPTLDFGPATPGADTADGGAGRDAVIIRAGPLAVSASLLVQGAAQDTGVGSVTLIGIEMLFSGDGADTLLGDGANNTLGGGIGADLLQGGDGRDALWGDGTVSGHRLTADTGSQYGGDDSLEGGSGADTLVGGIGSDRLTGGGGADRFVFLATDASAANAGAVDVIADLAANEWIDLAAIDADTGVSGDQAFTVVETFSGAAAEARVWFDGADTHIDMNTDADADLEARILIAGDHRGHADLAL